MFCSNGYKSNHGIFVKVLKVIGFTIAGLSLAVIFALVFSILVMHLWNKIMPDIFGIKTITFWQAFFIILLSKLLFGHFGHHPGHKRGHFHKKFGSSNNTDLCCDEPELYKKFWEDEGKKAFEEYLKKQKSGG